jgi:hypothetical protein
LLVDLLPHAFLSPALLGELSWLSLVGSIPTALVLGAAFRAARLPRLVVTAFALVIGLLGFALAWGHTDFLLSGPRWTVHPQRGLLRAAMASGLGAIGAAGWWWLVLGARTKSPARRAAWTLLTLVAIGSIVIAVTRYRAYEYSMAQAVFPGGVLAAAVIHLHASGSKRWAKATLGAAIVVALLAVASRLSPDWVAKGEREVIAQSRAGAMLSLYVIPHLRPETAWRGEVLDCPPSRPVVEQAPLFIPARERRNVIIITVDALRKDVVGAAVGDTPVMPELSRLAERGISFENATTTYPATLFAIGSAFTGLSPAELYLSPRLPETIFTWTRASIDEQLLVLPDVGWFRLPIVVELLAPGVDATFVRSDRAATNTLIEKLEAARRRGDSVMAWIHYYAPHDPYRSHPSYPFGKGRKNAYLSDVAYFDAKLGKLLRHLTDSGWLEDTLVVFFSDHGEALGEKNGYFGHHVYLDGWMVDVPLVLWHQSFEPSRPRVGVSVTDIAPTVLHFLGLPQPAGLPSQSLFALQPDDTSRPTFSEAFPVRGRELFDSFQLPALDDATIRARMRGIRLSSKGYEPKGAITKDGARLIHHRSADTSLAYDRHADGTETRMAGPDAEARSKLLRSELEQWEREQLRRIRCRLKVAAPR